MFECCNGIFFTGYFLERKITHNCVSCALIFVIKFRFVFQKYKIIL